MNLSNDSLSDLRQVSGRIHSTESFGAVDGPGVRFVVFLQGCTLRCWYCHNPDSCKFGEGELITAGALFDQIIDYRSFIEKGGVTLSGGDPLAQPQFCFALISLCKQAGLHTAIDTSGYLPLEQTEKTIDLADMLLLDLKELDPQDCRQLTGQTNENTLATLDYCEKTGKPVWIRHVCVPGYTLTPQKLERLAAFLKSYTCVEKVELIPFHQMGSYKWDYIAQTYQLKDTPVPTSQEMQTAKQIFADAGINIQ